MASDTTIRELKRKHELELSRIKMQCSALLGALEGCWEWADNLRPYSEDGTEVVPVFRRAKQVIDTVRRLNQ